MKKIVMSLTVGLLFLFSCSSDDAVEFNDNSTQTSVSAKTRSSAMRTFYTSLALYNETGQDARLDYMLDNPIRFVYNGLYPMEPEDLMNPVPNYWGTFEGAQGQGKTFVIHNNRVFHVNATGLSSIDVIFTELFNSINSTNTFFNISVVVKSADGTLLNDEYYETDLGGILSPETISVDMRGIPAQSKYVIEIVAIAYSV